MRLNKNTASVNYNVKSHNCLQESTLLRESDFQRNHEEERNELFDRLKYYAPATDYRLQTEREFLQSNSTFDEIDLVICKLQTET